MENSDTVIIVPSAERDQVKENHVQLVTAKAGKAIANSFKKDSGPGELDLSSKVRDWTSRILRFLSNASNETLCACVVGLAAATYLVLGRVGLLLIGVIGGVLLHAIWEDTGSEGVNDGVKALEARKRREKGLDVVERLLDWREDSSGARKSPKAGGTDTKIISEDLDFSAFPPKTKGALEGFTGAIIRDYVHWWYGPILPSEESFPFACRQTLNRFLLSVSSHLSRKRPADVFLDFLTNSSSIVIVFLSELSCALAASSSPEPQGSIDEYLRDNPGGSLANVLDEGQQGKKLKAVADDILHTFLDARAYACDPVRAFLREVLACLILNPTVASCSRADFINEWIIYALEEGDTTELVQAIDAGVSSATSNGAVGRVATAANQPDSSIEPQPQAKTDHRRTLSRAEDAMEEAMQEAKRLSELIAAEEANKAQHVEETALSATDPMEQASSGSSQADDNIAMKNSTAANSGNTEDRTVSPSLASRESASAFKSFNQILSFQQPTALKPDTSISPSISVASLTLHNAKISIIDDSVPGEKGNIRSKPVVDYLLQIEPATSHYPGWMIARKYSDFETLHEVLRRISVVSGVAAFTERYQALPNWKSKSKPSLRAELECYLQDALSFQRLAESEGMKRFFEKDQHLGKSSPGASKSGFGFPSPAAFETMGKGMLDVLSSAPKGAAVGGKAIVGGVTGVFGGVGSLGQKKQPLKNSVDKSRHRINGSTNTLPRAGNSDSPTHEGALGWPSEDSFQQPLDSSQQNSRSSLNEPNEFTGPPPLRRRQSHDVSSRVRDEPSIASGAGAEDLAASSPQTADPNQIHLPPPPSEIPDDYSTIQPSPGPSLDDNLTLRTFASTAPTTHSPSHKSTASSLPYTDSPSSVSPEKPKRPTPLPLTIQETSVAVELFFATINELYNLSSAWTLRLALLNTAKSFLLRPGNANLEAIRQLLQSTILDSNTSDDGIASHLNKIRENALPTEEELKAWPPPPSEEEKERKRKKARKLLVEKGMPQALTSVMGQAASGEALGKVFDCLQIPEVAKGLVFALVLQAVRAVTQ